MSKPEDPNGDDATWISTASLSDDLEKASWKLLFPLFGLAAVYAVGLSILLSRRFVVPETSSELYLSFFGLFLTWWVMIDVRERRTEVPYDFGYFILCTWPISIPYYILRTRGWKGGLLVAGLVGLWVAPMIFAALAAALYLKHL
jgi:hypothetical protein